VGVACTAIVARFGFRSTREATDAAIAAAAADRWAQIEADRRSRVWEKQAVAYTDAIAGIRQRQKVRGGLWQGMLTGTEPERPPVPVDWVPLEAQLLAYASPGVLDALAAAAASGTDYETAVDQWKFSRQQAQSAAATGIPLPPGLRPEHERERVEYLLRIANDLDDRLMDLIRAELHAGTDVVPAPPVPLARPAQLDEE
jgi:hypothetical protein